MGQVKPPLLLKKGAEASLYLTEWHNRKAVMKKRLPKKYRHPKLEEQIRTYRTIHESQLLHEAKKVGVSTPSIFLVDVKRSNIIMEFIEGKQMKKLLGEVPERERKQLCFQIGKLIAKLHRGGIIHGDLTTSNMIMNAEGKIFFVDFGLGEKSDETESRGVDLHLMRRALQSTHFRFADSCFQAAVKGYCRVLGTEVAKNVLDKVAEIERRGRYVAERRTSE